MSLQLRKLSANIFATLARQMGASIANLVTVIVIARFFGPEGNGIYSVTLLFPQLLATLLNLGITPSAVYYVNSGQFSLRQAWTTSLKVVAAMSAMGVVAGFIAIQYFSATLFGTIAPAILLIGLAVFPVTLLQHMIAGMFQAQQNFKSYNLVLLAQPAIALVLVVTLVLIGAEDITLFIWAYFASVCTSVILGLIAIWRSSSFAKSAVTTDRFPVAAKLLGYGLKTHLGSITAFLNNRLDLLIVNGFLGPAAAGAYVIAVQIAEKVWLVSKSVSTVLLPRLSELSNDDAKRKELTPMVSRWLLWLSFFICVGIALIGSYLIDWVFGDEYANSYLPLLILLPGIICGAASRVLANDIASRGKPEINLYFGILSLVVNVILNIILIPRLGLIGAAAATSFTYFLTLLSHLLVHRYYTGVPIHKNLIPTRHDLMLLQSFIRK